MSDEYSFRYEHCDVPEGMTLSAWRSAHAEPAGRRLRDLFARR
jgi:hypothetical protein